MTASIRSTTRQPAQTPARKAPGRHVPPGFSDVPCVDCVATGHPQPELSSVGSTRCYEHQRLRDLHMAAGRNRRARAKKRGAIGPDREEWSAQYKPRAIHDGPSAILIPPEHLDRIRDLQHRLGELQVIGNAAYRSSDPDQVPQALCDVLDALDQTQALLATLGTSQGPVPGSPDGLISARR